MDSINNILIKRIICNKIYLLDPWNRVCFAQWITMKIYFKVVNYYWSTRKYIPLFRAVCGVVTSETRDLYLDLINLKATKMEWKGMVLENDVWFTGAQLLGFCLFRCPCNVNNITNYYVNKRDFRWLLFTRPGAGLLCTQKWILKTWTTMKCIWNR
jgi:hypothetical protein